MNKLQIKAEILATLRALSASDMPSPSLLTDLKQIEDKKTVLDVLVRELVNADEFMVLRKYVKHTIKELSSDMLAGNIGISPYKSKESTSCDFCHYSSICQFDSTMKDNDYRVINKKDQDEIINKMRGEIE